MLRDDNRQIHFTLDSFNSTTCAPTAFAGATTNARGDDGGTNDPFTLFTVTGTVLLRVFGIVTTDLTGASATVEVGVVGNTASLIALTVATTLDAGHIWTDASPVLGVDALANLTGPFIVANGADIVETVATANVTAGNIYYICLWRPLSSDGNVVSAV